MVRALKPARGPNGFTLVEVLLSIVLLALIGTAVSALYASAGGLIDEQMDRILLDSHLRSRMEFLLSTYFASLSSGSESVSVNGKNFSINWTVAGVDLDGDSNPEPDAKQVTVSVLELPARSLTAIIMDSENRVKKIS
jgi:prepilin-type N-terminal cleavage/methylation domain-containing protein